MKKIIIILFCTLILLPSFVHAHTSLTSSNPAEGQVVTENLEEISLTFGTPIEVLSTMELVKDGTVIPLEDIKVENKQLLGTIAKPLENGSYIIQWKIVGEDGHPIKGEINFIVEMAQNDAEPTPDAPEKTEANKEDKNEADQIEPKKDEQNIASDTSEENDEQNNNSLLITVFIVLIVIFGIVLLMFTRKKR